MTITHKREISHIDKRIVNSTITASDPFALCIMFMLPLTSQRCQSILCFLRWQYYDLYPTQTRLQTWANFEYSIFYVFCILIHSCLLSAIFYRQCSSHKKPAEKTKSAKLKPFCNKVEDTTERCLMQYRKLWTSIPMLKKLSTIFLSKINPKYTFEET